MSSTLPLKATLHSPGESERQMLLEQLHRLSSRDLLLLDRGYPCRWLAAWLTQRQIPFSSITLFEARYGLNLLPEGQRKRKLFELFEEIVQTDLANRIVVFDVRAAGKAAELAAVRKSRGRPVDIRDTFIAGIAMANGATLATRNTKHFEDLSTPVVNPWQ